MSKNATGKTGGQFNNKNAETWTEERALALGEELIEWLSVDSNRNVIFGYFLLVEKGLHKDTIAYLQIKFPSFLESMKKARDIQKFKMESFGLIGKTNVGMSAFLLKAVHGLKEDEPINDFKLEKALEVKRYLTLPKECTSNFHNTISYLRKGKKIIIHRGGTRSSKTYSIAQLYIDWLFSGDFGSEKIEGHAGVFRQALPHLKKTVLVDLLEILDSRNMLEGTDYIHHRSDKYFKVDNRKLYYDSINSNAEVQKVRGLGLGLVWFNEANEIPYEAFNQLFMRGRDNLIIILDFNPSDENVWINEEIEKTDKYRNVATIVSTFEDNDFLSEEQKDRIRDLKKIDKQLWEIYGRGQYGVIEGKVYPKWSTYKDLPPGEFLKFYGEDLGYVVSKDAVMEVNWLEGTRDVYIKSRLYQTGLETHDLLNAMKSIVTDDEIVFADCSDRRLLSTLKNNGIKNLLRPKKGRLKMVKYVRSFRIHIHEDDVDTIREIKSYKLIKDPKTNRFTNEPVKFMDDLMNAFEYAIIGLVEVIFTQSKINISELK